MKITTGQIFKYLVLIIFVVFTLLPVFIMWFSALKTSDEIYKDPFGLPSTFQWQNFIKAWKVGHFGNYFFNTIIITFSVVFLVISLSSLAGYAFGKIKFAGSKILFYIFLIGIMVPFPVIMIAIYYTVVDLHIVGTYFAMILPYTAIHLAFAIFFMRAFFLSLPYEIKEAALIDGCNEFTSFLKIMLPLAKPAIYTLIVFEFMWAWNAFLEPLVLLNKESLRPITVGLLFFRGEYNLDQGLTSAAVTIASLPVVIVFIIFQKQFIKGITAGATKG